MSNARRVLTGAVVLAASVAPLFAAQLVRFKNGFEMEANAVRFEGEMAILVLDGGSEIGFPRNVLDVVHEDQTLPGEVYHMSGRNKVRQHYLLNGTPVASPLEAARAAQPKDGTGRPDQGADKVLFDSGRVSDIGPGGMNVGFTYDGKTGRTGANSRFKRDDSDNEMGIQQRSPTLSGNTLPVRKRLVPSMIPEYTKQYK